MDAFPLPSVQEDGVMADTSHSMLMFKGRLYKTQLGSSLPDLSSRLQRQRNRMPKQYEKFSFQVRTDTSPERKSKLGYLPILTPRTPVVVEARGTGYENHGMDQAKCETHESQVLEIHADVLDITFNANAKPGMKPPWKPDCFCPRCGFMREQWVEENRKPFRPFSRQRESTLLALNVARERTRLGAQSEQRKNVELIQSITSASYSDVETEKGVKSFMSSSSALGIQR